MAKQHGLSIEEQAIILENLCRHGDSCESCPCNFMQDVENCPFEWDCVLMSPSEVSEIENGIIKPTMEQKRKLDRYRRRDAA